MNAYNVVTAIAAVSAAALLTEPALAASDIFATLQSKGQTTFTNVRNITFIVGGFGIIAIAVTAFFGRFNFRTFASLIGGLVILAAAASLISYVTTSTTGTESTSSTPGWSDTFNAQ